MKILVFAALLTLPFSQESEPDRIHRQFKQAQNNATTEKEYAQSIQEARKALQDYLERNPKAADRAKAAWLHAETFLYSLEFPAAMAAFDTFVLTYPKDNRVASAKLAAAEICMRLERDEAARRRLESWKKEYANDARLFQVRIFLAALLVFEKKFAEASSALGQLRAQHRGTPKEWTAAMQLAACHHVAEKNSAAKQVLEEIIRDCSDDTLVQTAKQYLREYSQLGRTLPSKKETDKDNKTLHLKAHEGKVIILYFFTSSLPIAESEVEFLRKTRKQFSGTDLVILGVCIDPQKRDFLNFRSWQNITWPLFYDGDGLQGYLARLYNVRGIPTLRVLDRGGKVRFYNVSGRDLRIVVERLIGESE